MRWLLIGLAACQQSGTAAIDAALNDASFDDADTPAFLFLGSSSLQDFGAVPIGLNIQRDVIVTNGGAEPTGEPFPALSGADAQSWMLPNVFCGDLGTGSSCDFTVTFAPTTAGSKVAAMSVTATPGGTVNVALKGMGVTTAITVSQSSIAFASTAVSHTSAPTVITVTNISSLTSESVVVALAGTNPGQFATGAQTCDGIQLGPNGTCTVSVDFAPTTATTSSASLTVTVNPLGSATVALSGTGTP